MTDKRILLGHGSGGTLMHDLIEEVIVSRFAHQPASDLADAALVDLDGGMAVFTTDSFVVTPAVFPGGDIGRLAVCGTINDIAVMGAKPVALTCALIIEEGLPISFLEDMLNSMAETATEAGVSIVTGDTKVVERGAVDGLFINTSGLGVLHGPPLPGLDGIAAGDAVLINGPVGQHGAAVMAAREGIVGLGDLQSDAAPLNDLIHHLLAGDIDVKIMRDPTRGGLATTLNEFVHDRDFGIELHEQWLPNDPAVDAYCDALGLDPLYVANEGKVVIVVDGSQAEQALAILRSHDLGRQARVIGTIGDARPGVVTLTTAMGGTRLLTMLAGEQLPRIC